MGSRTVRASASGRCSNWRRVVTAHREWLRGELTAALSQAGAARPARLAARVQLLYDGGLVGSKATHSFEPIEQA
ncbi:MAG TPA: hypothetical protein VGP05_22775, partial [Pseudonocardia sp.]|nr:hypothetical protein [Pseudonocardia sp.]